MMISSSRDVERLSAYLDGQCSASDTARVESRIQTDKDYAALLSGLRHNRILLEGLRRQRLPRNFTLKPGMTGLRPPLPRAVPALSWASVTAMVVFLFSFGANFLGAFPLGAFPLGATAPMMAAAPVDSARGMGGAEASDATGTPAPEMMLMTVQESTAEPVENPASAAVATKSLSQPLSPWLIILPVLALALFSSALVIRWNTVRVFKRRIKS